MVAAAAMPPPIREVFTFECIHSDRQGAQFGARQGKHQWQQKIIPTGDELHDNYCSDHGLCQRQHDLQENTQETGTVYNGRFFQFLRQLSKVAGEKQDEDDVGTAALGKDYARPGYRSVQGL